MVSNGKLDCAAKHIRMTNDLKSVIDDIELISNWRSLHSVPLRAVLTLVRSKLKRKGVTDYVIGQRLKRMPSIITKIKRFEKMKVSRMQDVGGIRIIVPNITDVYSVFNAITHTKSKHEVIIPAHDYIKEPKKDGYRSIHQVFKYHNSKQPDYDGMRIEVQIRTKLQHQWSTAVETLGVINQASYKTGEGTEDEKRYFKIVSALFSMMEEQPVLEEFRDWSKEALVQELKELDKKLLVISKLSSVSTFFERIKDDEKKSRYYVLVLKFTDGTKGFLNLTPFDKEEDAQDFYTMREIKYQNEKDKFVLMINSDSMKNIKKAYPNYFLDTQNFVKKLRKFIEN